MNHTNRVRGFSAIPNIDLPGTSFDYLNNPLNNLISTGIGWISGQQPNQPGAPGNTMTPPPASAPASAGSSMTPLIIGAVAVGALFLFLKK